MNAIPFETESKLKLEIHANLDNPGQLEKLYRNNKAAFKHEFNLIYPDIKHHSTARIWYERLNYSEDGVSFGSGRELGFVLTLALIAGFIANIPDFFGVNEEWFYPRNISFAILPLLTAYFAWKNALQLKQIAILAIASIGSVLYINFLPGNEQSDTFILACIHLPIFMWALLGFGFVGDKWKNLRQRLEFLRYNADLVVMTTIILIAGGILTGVTMGLFTLIDIELEEILLQNIVMWGVAASPIVATWLMHSNPQLVSRVSPLIAKIFTPLVLITLVIYIAAVIYTGKDPYTDREFLLIFNVLLIGVMAIILFSIVGTSNTKNNSTNTLMLTCLSVVTIIVNGIALSAILFRITEWGLTPNRLAVLGGNLLILTNLLIVTAQLFRSMKQNQDTAKAGNSIARFLPVFAGWALIVAVLFPLLFGE